MAIREMRGIMVGLLQQQEIGPVAINFIDEAPPNGKVNAAGLVTIPLIEPTVVRADPIVDGTALLAGGDAAMDTPSGSETRQAAQQAGPPLPWWLLAGLVAAFI